LQYKTDSLRAIDWFQKTKDSSYLEKYTWEEQVPMMPGGGGEDPMPEKKSKSWAAIIPNDRNNNKSSERKPA
jgi:hypothetical protein